MQLPAGLKPGGHAIAATYRGTVGVARSSGCGRVTVTKAKPKIVATLARKSISRAQHARVRVLATIPNATPGSYAVGRIVVRDGGRVVKRLALRQAAKGRLTVTLPLLAKGRHAITIRLQGTALQVAAVSGDRTLRVR
ncbi:hypothetical protein GCM10023350_37290 [Nocardioides endophyticus]|uniref:Ig-like domain repeat protein n=1 Tax=Nocardioides endophyticus TaxID=1353775 RepID=A0ABP8Z7Q2_9ACTN